MVNLSKQQRAAETAAVKEFVSELFRGILPHERVMVSYAEDAQVQTGADGKRRNNGFFPSIYREERIDVDANCYVPISSSIKSLNVKTDEWRFWRGVDNFGRGFGFFIDDVGSGVGSKGSLRLSDIEAILPPSAVVESSPGNFQVWYFLSAPEDNRFKFKGFLDSFVWNVLRDRGGDVTIKDIQRVGRLPAGYNNKRLPDGSLKYPEGFRVRLLYSDYDTRYTLDEIASAFGFVIEIRTPRPRDPDADRSDANARWLEIARIVLSAAQMGEGRGGAVEMNMSGKYRLRCINAGHHGNGDPYGAYMRGKIPSGEFDYVYDCSHDFCKQNKWRASWSYFVDTIVMPAIVAKLDDANAAAPDTLDGWRLPIRN